MLSSSRVQVSTKIQKIFVVRKCQIFVTYDIWYEMILLLLLLLLFTAVGLSPGGSGYFTCIQNMKLVTNKFKSGGLHEKHVVATWNVGNRLSICL